MKQVTFTIGTKLFGSFAAMFALTLAFVFIYESAVRDSSHRLDNILQWYNRKLAIGFQVELATMEMGAAQRGFMLSYAMHDPGASGQYKQLYQDSGKKLDGLLSELQPLLATNTERNAMAQIEENRKTWSAGFQKLIAVCESGNIAQAYKFRNVSKVISAKMTAAASDLADQQKVALEEASTVAAAKLSQSDWMALIAIGFSVFLGGTVLVIIRNITRQLRRAIAELHEGAGQVARASGRLSASSQRLAQGASQQAASIEETSASAEEIRVMTRRNADHSRDAAALMLQTSDIVSEANHSLDEIHLSMREIDAASGRIRKIIRVIEEIAFQTNILALNAAVEAARAGVAGQGFAVVADEVRSLSQRCAQAAQDTAQLIEESAAKSNHGHGKLDRALAAIVKITDSAEQVRKLIDDVKVGNEEQARGIQQISQALSQMEQVTQNTVAAAEETAAAGESMNQQAQTLDIVVEQLHAMVG